MIDPTESCSINHTIATTECLRNNSAGMILMFSQ